MAQIIDIDNEAPIFNVKEVVIGSQWKFAIRFRHLVSQDPDTFADFDFSGMILEADVKDKPKTDVTPDAVITCTPRVPNDGWVDFFMDGDATASLLPKKYLASLKVYPTGHPELGDTLCQFTLNVKLMATR